MSEFLLSRVFAFVAEGEVMVEIQAERDYDDIAKESSISVNVLLGTRNRPDSHLHGTIRIEGEAKLYTVQFKGKSAHLSALRAGLRAVASKPKAAPAPSLNGNSTNGKHPVAQVVQPKEVVVAPIAPLPKARAVSETQRRKDDFVAVQTKLAANQTKCCEAIATAERYVRDGNDLVRKVPKLAGLTRTHQCRLEAATKQMKNAAGELGKVLRDIQVQTGLDASAAQRTESLFAEILPGE